MGEVTAVVFGTFAVVGPFVLWYLLDSKVRALPVQLRAKTEGMAQADTEDRAD